MSYSKSIAIITQHDFLKGRKTGIHFFYKYFHRISYNTIFITVGVSHFSKLRKHRRFFSKPYNRLNQKKKYLFNYVWMSIFHPFYIKSKFLSKLFGIIFILYPFFIPKNLLFSLKKLNTKIFIIENGVGILLIKKIKTNFPNAKLIYQVSDDINVINYHPIIKTYEKKYLFNFNFIRLNSREFMKNYSNHNNVLYVAQGIDKESFDKNYKNPYTGPKNVISIGDMFLDKEIILKLANFFPDWKFHIFGKMSFIITKNKNIINYGEIDFHKLIPYIKFADIAIASYQFNKHISYLIDSSLKLKQYQYCSLPILIPNFLKIKGKNFFQYPQGDDETLKKIFKKLFNFKKNLDESLDIKSWEDVAKIMIKNI